MVKEILLTQGKVAIVDDGDYDFLNQWKWRAQRSYNSEDLFYAVREEYFGVVAGKRIRKAVLMHRVITNAPKGMDVDHINHNCLDNRRKNLRVVSRRQNMQNSRWRNKASKFPGVRWFKSNQKWGAMIWINNKQHFLGLFNEERSAARAYERACRDLCGEELVCKLNKRD